MTSLIVKAAGRALAPFILLSGVYVASFGFLSPGGGFQGGILLASGVILIMVTHGCKEVHRLAENIDWFETFGALTFLIVGLTGLLVGGYLFSNLLPDTPLMCIVLDIVIALKVFAGTVAVFVYFFGMGVEEC